MDANQASIQALNTAFTTAFNMSLAGVETSYNRVAMTVRSTSKTQSYPKLSEMGGMREWIGDRVIERFDIDAFQITNRKFEKTFAVSVDEIDDDDVGLYSNLSTDHGQSVGELPDDLVWDQLEKGFDTIHFDGQNFFDTDHPVEDKNGDEQSVSNFTDGVGPAWYLMDVSRAIRPLIFQDRLAPQFAALTNLNDPNVFFQDEYVWGSKRRCAAGFGAWQLVYASKAPLTAENYAAARKAMLEMRGHKGRKLKLNPRLLVVSAANEGAAREILMNERDANGATNKWRNTAELHVETRLAA